jgi:hypothetical protein
MELAYTGLDCSLQQPLGISEKNGGIMGFSRSLVFATLLAAILNPASATAVPLTFIYEGLIDSILVPTAYESAFNPFLGKTIRVEYTFESTTPDSDPHTSYGEYLDAITGITMTLGAVVYSASFGHIGISNDIGVDQYGFVVFGVFDGMTGPSVGGLFPERFSLALQDGTSTFFSSDTLPTMQPDPSAFPFLGGMSFLFSDPADPIYLGGTEFVQLSSNNLYVVPEPASASLLAAGLATLAIRVRRRTRRRVEPRMVRIGGHTSEEGQLPSSCREGEKVG